MPILKCKMCGGDLQIEEGMTVCECEYCSTKQTVPTIDNEKKIKLFERANRLRMDCQFDKAATVYESIIEEFDSEAEGYWGNLLCKYGIEYVDDPATGNKVPTCHRSSFDSVMDDKDFEMVMENCDAISRNVYREQAKQIEEIRKGIIEVSGKEEPYDIFICYKETAEDGQRTIDSVIAQDVYDVLTDKGYRVFFSRITLEDKIGTEYEPYIFAALNSAKVMLAFGTTYDYYNAVWVKNEWSRYLKLMAKDKTKHLIPCYKDIDAYDIPKEFAKLQAQDMGKVGATQDLLRGIEKILGTKKQEVVKETVVVQGGNNTNVTAMIKRGNLALEDKEWDKADKFFEEALNQDPECADAYLGKLLTFNKVDSLDNYFSKLESKYSSATSEKLYACNEDSGHIHSIVKENVLEGYLEADVIKRLYVFDRSYMSALSCRKEQKSKQQNEIESDKLLTRVRQYASGELKEQIESGLEKLISIHDSRIAEEEKSDEAKKVEITTNYEAHIEEADKKAFELRQKADKEKYKHYKSTVTIMKTASTISAYERARDGFKALGVYEDSFELAKECQSEINRIQSQIDRIKEEERLEKERVTRKTIKIAAVTIGAIVAIVAAILIVVKVVIPTNKYNKAIDLKRNGQYSEAITAFENLSGYKDSNTQVLECKYNIASSYMKEEKYSEAITVFEKLDGYKDSNELLFGIKSSVDCIRTLSIGQSFYYGNYNNEPIEWTILDIKDNQVFAITTNAIDKRRYNDIYTDVTWASCSLRQWLNDEFLNKAFSPEEQLRIMTTTVTPDTNPVYSTNPGSSTEDKVFLLSIDEVNQYFSTNESRTCKYNGTACWWRLRTPGSSQDHVGGVNFDGAVDCYGYGVDYVDEVRGAVRPALWINLES